MNSEGLLVDLLIYTFIFGVMVFLTGNVKNDYGRKKKPRNG
jgi:hypothetical protein